MQTKNQAKLYQTTLSECIPQNTGITLIALIITIIVLLILAGVTLLLVTGEGGILGKATWASFVAELSSVDENIKVALLENTMKVYEGEDEPVFKNQVTQEMPDTLCNELAELRGDETVGDLYWVPKDLGNGKEQTYVYDTKIKVVFKVEGIKIGKKRIHSIHGAQIEERESKVATMEIDSNYGYYEPDLNGFNLNSTYIIYYSSDCNDTYEMGLEDYISQGKPQTHTFVKDGEKVTYYFHNYNQEDKVWANVKTVANGLEAWWVWIPRYAYDINTTGKTVDAVFTNISNDSLNTNHPFTGDDTGEYILHPAFSIKDGETTKELKGIWMAKYQAETTNLKDTTIEVPEGKVCYEPKLVGYNVNSTYIATYYENGTETGKRYLLREILADGCSCEENGILISGTIDSTKIGEGEYWYDYDRKIWGNIITNANGLEAWWVWIPRYAYCLNTDGKNVDILFITTGNKTITGSKELGLYTVHPAFTLDDGTELEGIWMAKYQASGTFTVDDAIIQED